MTAEAPRAFRLADLHAFQAAGRQFHYLVPGGGIFGMDETAAQVVDCLTRGAVLHDHVRGERLTRGIPGDDAPEPINELCQARALSCGESISEPPRAAHFPIQTLVPDFTNHLSCEYCYEYVEDKVATPEGKPKFMDFKTAKAAVDLLFEQWAGRRLVHVAFFGGETVMNLLLLKRAVGFAAGRAKARGGSIDFSLTANATLLTPAIIKSLAENRTGVTVPMRGAREFRDLRVFSNGRGSYDVVAPKERVWIGSRRTRPIAARVTLTSGVTDVVRIFRHLKDDLGFHEIGFAPVTTSPDRLYAINDRGMDRVLEQFRIPADEYLEFALRGETHGFSNASDTLVELPGRRQIASLRNRSRFGGRWSFGRQCASARLCRFRSPRHRSCLYGRRRMKAGRFSPLRRHSCEIRLPRLPGAAPVCVMRLSCATATQDTPTCITAIGCAAEPTDVCASTARSPCRGPSFWITSRRGKLNEAFESCQ